MANASNAFDNFAYYVKLFGRYNDKKTGKEYALIKPTSDNGAYWITGEAIDENGNFYQLVWSRAKALKGDWSKFRAIKLERI